MAPQALLKTILLLLASSPTLLPCAFAAPVSTAPSETCVSPCLRLLGPRACEILRLRTECSHQSEQHQLAITLPSPEEDKFLRRRQSVNDEHVRVYLETLISTDSDAYDAAYAEQGVAKAPDDGGFGAQLQPYRPPQASRPHSYHYGGAGASRRRADRRHGRRRGMCSQQGRGRPNHPLSLACQLLHRAGYRTRDFQRLTHKLWLAVRGMPEKFAVAGAVAVFVVVVVLVAAERLGRTSQSRRRKRKEWRTASRRGIGAGKRHTPTLASSYARNLNRGFRADLWTCLQKRARLLKTHLKLKAAGASRVPVVSEMHLHGDVEKQLLSND